MKQLHWIRVDCHTPDHPKVRRLERMVGDAALAYLVRLWAKAATYSPDGDLSGLEVEEIEDWARWAGDAGALVDALVACGFIDDGDTVQLHGWEERQAERSRVRAAGAERARRFRRKVASATKPQDQESTVTPPPAEPERRNAGSVTPVTLLPVTPTNERTDERTKTERERAGARPGPEEPDDDGSSSLSQYLDALREIHPRFGLEDLVARALYTRRVDLPPLGAFVAALREHAATEEWRSGFAKTADKWVLGGGWKSPPPPPRRRGSSAELLPAIGARPVPPPEPISVTSRIADLLASLPDDLPGRDVVGGRIAALAHLSLPPEEVDARLLALQDETRERLLAELPDAKRRELELSMDRLRERLAPRMAQSALEEAIARTMRQAAGAIYRLPELTLFARPGGAEEAEVAS